MTPELKQNIIVTIYLLLLHNWLVILFIIGLIISLGWLIHKPTRSKVLYFIGFGLLVFGFEYCKHISDGLVKQTTDSLITITRHYKLEWTIRICISKILPIFFYLLGVLFIIIGFFINSEKKLFHLPWKRGNNKNSI